MFNKECLCMEFAIVIVVFCVGLLGSMFIVDEINKRARNKRKEQEDVGRD